MARRRRRGDGSAFFDKNAGAWVVVVVSLGTVQGKRIRRKVRVASRREAEAERERLLRTYRQGFEPSRGTLDQYLADWHRRLIHHRQPSLSSLMLGHPLP